MHGTTYTPSHSSHHRIHFRSTDHGCIFMILWIMQFESTNQKISQLECILHWMSGAFGCRAAPCTPLHWMYCMCCVWHKLSRVLYLYESALFHYFFQHEIHIITATAVDGPVFISLLPLLLLFFQLVFVLFQFVCFAIYSLTESRLRSTFTLTFIDLFLYDSRTRDCVLRYVI